MSRSLYTLSDLQSLQKRFESGEHPEFLLDFMSFRTSRVAKVPLGHFTVSVLIAPNDYYNLLFLKNDRPFHIPEFNDPQECTKDIKVPELFGTLIAAANHSIQLGATGGDIPSRRLLHAVLGSQGPNIS